MTYCYSLAHCRDIAKRPGCMSDLSGNAIAENKLQHQQFGTDSSWSVSMRSISSCAASRESAIWGRDLGLLLSSGRYGQEVLFVQDRWSDPSRCAARTALSVSGKSSASFSTYRECTWVSAGGKGYKMTKTQKKFVRRYATVCNSFPSTRIRGFLP